MTDFQDIIDEVREERLQEIDTPGTAQAPLRGECFENAYALAKKCDEKGLDPYIVTGGLDFEREEAPLTAKEAFDRGQHHFWVVVNGTHLDISGEWLSSHKEGEPLIGSPPSHYKIYRKTEFNSVHSSPEYYL